MTADALAATPTAVSLSGSTPRCSTPRAPSRRTSCAVRSGPPPRAGRRPPVAPHEGDRCRARRSPATSSGSSPPTARGSRRAVTGETPRRQADRHRRPPRPRRVPRRMPDGLLRLLAGLRRRRAADVVLAGHTHRHNEFTVRPTAAGQLEFRMDFYTQNPAAYYPTRFLDGWAPISFGAQEAHTDVTYVEVSAAAPPWADPWPMPRRHARPHRAGAAVRRSAGDGAGPGIRGGPPIDRSCCRPPPSVRWRTARSASAGSARSRCAATSSSRDRARAARPPARGGLPADVGDAVRPDPGAAVHLHVHRFPDEQYPAQPARRRWRRRRAERRAVLYRDGNGAIRPAVTGRRRRASRPST